MDCFNDFCIACDKQSHNGSAYCSQACRLADLETARTGTQLSSPRTTTQLSSPGIHSTPVHSVNSPSTSSQSPRSSSSYFAPHYSYGDAAAIPRSLTPSSSRSSLSSTMSTSIPKANANGNLTDRAMAELRSYYNSFDKVKDSKRRSSTR